MGLVEENQGIALQGDIGTLAQSSLSVFAS
jgi:hypothetical protein